MVLQWWGYTTRLAMPKADGQNITGSRFTKPYDVSQQFHLYAGWRSKAGYAKIYFFHQITTFIKVRETFVFWTPDPLIDRFYSSPPIKGFAAQKQRPHELL